MCHNKDIADSPFFNIFSNLPLRPFSRDEAVELIQCLFIKLSEMSILWDFDSASYWSGFSMTLGLVAGGVDEDGNDATNELSYLLIEADKNTGLLQPELGIRVHTHTLRGNCYSKRSKR